MQINLAPLRERKQDIPLLVDYFLEKCEAGQSKAKFSDAAMRYLCDHDWPETSGNWKTRFGGQFRLLPDRRLRSVI